MITFFSFDYNLCMEECPFIRRVGFLFHSRTLDFLRCDIYNGRDQLIHQVSLQNCQNQQIELGQEERHFYCLLINETPQIQQYFSFRVPAVLDQALKVTRNKQYKEFSLKVQVDVGFRDHGNPFPTQKELENFAKKHIKKLSSKIMKRLEAEKTIAGNPRSSRRQVSRKEQRPRTVLIRASMKSSVKTIKENQTTLDETRRKISQSQGNKRKLLTLKRMASKDGSQKSQGRLSRRNRKSSVIITTKTSSPSPGIRQKQARKTEPVPSPKNFKTYLEKRTITQMESQKETIDLMKQILAGTASTIKVKKEKQKGMNNAKTILKKKGLGGGRSRVLFSTCYAREQRAS